MRQEEDENVFASTPFEKQIPECTQQQNKGMEIHAAMGVNGAEKGKQLQGITFTLIQTN